MLKVFIHTVKNVYLQEMNYNMFKITETITPNIEEYWEIKPQYNMTKEQLMTTVIQKESEIYVNPYASIEWGETHTNKDYNNEVYSKIPIGGYILDIGCGGGGFIEQCINDGYKAIGIEIGNGYKITNAFSWKNIPNNLFIRDFGQSLQITYNDEPVKFDFIHSWDVFEHIRVGDIDQVCKNMVSHSHKDTIHIHKIATWHGYSHRNVHEESWWWNKFNSYGFTKIGPFSTALREQDGLMFYMKLEK